MGESHIMDELMKLGKQNGSADTTTSSYGTSMDYPNLIPTDSHWFQLGNAQPMGEMVPLPSKTQDEIPETKEATQETPPSEEESALSDTLSDSQPLEAVNAQLKMPQVSNTVVKPAEDATVAKKYDEFVQKVQSLGYNTDELGTIFKETAPQQLVDSIAGAGKTTAILFKLFGDIYSGRVAAAPNSKIWVNTFSKAGATDLGIKQEEIRQKLGLKALKTSLKISTIHSELMRVLRQLNGWGTFDIISDKTHRQLINKASAKYRVGGNPGFLTTDEIKMLDVVESLRQGYIKKQKAVNEVKTMKELGTLDILETTTIGDLFDMLEEVQAKRVTLKQITFDDVQRLIYNAMQNPNGQDVTSLLAKRYGFIYFDEFQDVSDIQYAILKAYVSGTTQVVLVGDCDQSIYHFRGANVNIITTQVREDYPQIAIHQLTTNYRCPDNILHPMGQLIEHNQNRYPKAVNAFKTGGDCAIETYDTYNRMVRAWLEKAEETEKSGKQVVTLCRTNEEIANLTLLLFERFRDSPVALTIGKNMMSFNDKRFKSLWSLAYLFQENVAFDDFYYPMHYHYGISKTQSSMIYELAAGRPLYRLTKGEILDEDNDLWPQTRTALDLIVTEMKEAVNDTRYQNKLLPAVAYLGALYQTIRQEWTKQFIHGDATAQQYWKILPKLDVYTKVTQRVDSIEGFLRAIRTFKIEQQNSQLANDFSMRIATPFEFKGLETDEVIVFNVCKGNYSYEDPKLIGTEYGQAEEEEARRLFYIAGTRAKKRCTYYTVKRHQSAFLVEAFLTSESLHLDERQDVSDDTKE